MNYGVKLMAKANEPKPVVGYQGGTVYDMNLKESIVNMLCLGLVQNNFYQDEKEVMAKTASIYKEAVQKCPEFLAKAAVYARNVVGMKLQPNIALVYLSTLQNKSLFQRAFAGVIKTPKDLHDFITLCRKTDIRGGLGRGVKKTVNECLNRQSEYNFCRYGGKLAEVMKVTRPIPSCENNQALFSYAIKGTISEGLHRASALKQVLICLEKGQVDSYVLNLIQTNRLQLEELKHAFGKLTASQKQDIFRFFIPGLAYMATVSNLVTIERAFGGTVPADVVKIVADKLADVEAYKRSRMLPFRLITARDMTSVREWQRSIERVINAGIKGVFDVPEGVKTLVAVDTSGSMGSALTPSLKCVQVASLFGAMCTLGIEGSSAYAVASSMKGVRVMTDEVFTLARDIENLNVGAGTMFGQIMNHYDSHKYVILITDGEPADNLEAAWAKANKPRGAKLIVWQLQPYGHKVSKRPDCIYFQGFSDALIGTIRNIIEGKGQLDDIEAVKI